MAMAKLTLATPFFVFVLSVLTGLLLWQDVSAREQKSISRPTDTAPPVTTPAEAVAEAEPAQEPGKGTWTLDGETRSFVVEKCSVFERGPGNYQVNGRVIGDDGSTMGFKLTSRLSMISDYMNNEINADVFRVDGSTVTVDGAFKTVSAPVTGHSIQMSFDCYDSPVASLAVAAVPAPTVSSVSNTESVAAAPTSPAVVSPVTAPEPGKGTITVDGETRSFAVANCKLSSAGGNYTANGLATGDAGYMVMFRLRKGPSVGLGFLIDVSRKEPVSSRTRYTARAKEAKEVVFRVDGSTVTMDGLFRMGNSPAPNTSIQMSFDCSG